MHSMLADTWKDGSVVLVKGLSPASLYIVTLPTLPIVNGAFCDFSIPNSGLLQNSILNV
jgi:hypothetical protein